MNYVYLDNAATAYPKPPSVESAFLTAAHTAFGNAGRSSHHPARLAADCLYDCRSRIASHFGGDATRVVFCESATHALNLAIKALTPPDSHLLLSHMEHNATLRPTYALQKKGVSYSLYACGAKGASNEQEDTAAVLASLEKQRKQNTVGVIACHRSNCLPLTLPLQAIGDYCHKNGLFFIVDAAQSAGTCRIDLERCHITALCAPGHKGLMGFRGTGFVLFGKAVKDEALQTLLEGGSGSDSLALTMPSLLPERLEAGTRPIEVIAALAEGIRFVEGVGCESIGEKEAYLSAYLKDRLKRLKHIRLLMPHRTSHATVLFQVDGKSPSAVAEALSDGGICLRDGLHCAPLAHRLVGSEKTGALRASFGYFNTERDADALVYALKHQ